MSKRAIEEQRESKRERKKTKRDLKQAKWRAKFLEYSNPRIEKAVAASLRDQLPILLVKDSPTTLARWYKFWPANQEIGVRVLNLLECLYNYGHVEENDDEDTEGDLASADHIGLVEALCRVELVCDDHALIDIYFHMTVDEIGRVEAEDDLSELPPLLYVQPCYGYF